MRSKVDPFLEPRWNTVQLFAWVAFRNKKLVRETRLSEETAHYNVHDSKSLIDPDTGESPLTFIELLIHMEHKKRSFVDIESEILLRLKQGDLQAYGRRYQTNEDQEIKPLEWDSLRFHMGELRSIPYVAKRLSEPYSKKLEEKEKWAGVRYSTESILRYWPERKSYRANTSPSISKTDSPAQPAPANTETHRGEVGTRNDFENRQKNTTDPTSRPPKRGPGRPRDTSQFPEDELAIIKMRELIEAKTVGSRNAAAERVAKEMEHSTSFENTVKRLNRKYGEQYP